MGVQVTDLESDFPMNDNAAYPDGEPADIRKARQDKAWGLFRSLLVGKGKSDVAERIEVARRLGLAKEAKAKGLARDGNIVGIPDTSSGVPPLQLATPATIVPLAMMGKGRITATATAIVVYPQTPPTPPTPPTAPAIDWDRLADHWAEIVANWSLFAEVSGDRDRLFKLVRRYGRLKGRQELVCMIDDRSDARFILEALDKAQGR
jgi:hypothetical protein